MSETNGTRYFIKEIVSNAVRLASGRRIPWKDVGDDTGVIETNDQGLISELRAAAKRGVGGIREVGIDEFDDAKKNSTAEQLRKLSLFRANNMFRQPRITDANNQPAAAAAVKQAPPTVSPAGQPIATPLTLPIPKPVSRRRSIVSDDAVAIATQAAQSAAE